MEGAEILSVTSMSPGRLLKFTEPIEGKPGYRRDPFTREELYSAAWLDADEETAPKGAADPVAKAQVDEASRALERLLDKPSGEKVLTGSSFAYSGPYPPPAQVEHWTRTIAVQGLRRTAANIDKLAALEPEDAEFVRLAVPALERLARELEDRVHE